MAGSLIKINEAIVTTATPSVTLTGIDSTYDVYMFKFNNLEVDTDTRSVGFRVTVSGTADTSTNYDAVRKALLTSGTFGNGVNINQNFFLFSLGDSLGTAGNETANGIFYLFNFANSSEYSFFTMETTQVNSDGIHRGNAGGGVHTVAQACDGIQLVLNGTGNISAGKFTLYGLKK